MLPHVRRAAVLHQVQGHEILQVQWCNRCAPNARGHSSAMVRVSDGIQDGPRRRHYTPAPETLEVRPRSSDRKKMPFAGFSNDFAPLTVPLADAPNWHIGCSLVLSQRSN